MAFSKDQGGLVVLVTHLSKVLRAFCRMSFEP